MKDAIFQSSCSDDATFTVLALMTLILTVSFSYDVTFTVAQRLMLLISRATIPGLSPLPEFECKCNVRIPLNATGSVNFIVLDI